MSVLPWTLVYGGVLWIGPLLLCGVGLALWLRWLVRARGRRRARLVASRVIVEPQPRTQLSAEDKGKLVELGGVLRLGGAGAADLATGRPVAASGLLLWPRRKASWPETWASTVGEGLCLELGDGRRVQLEGPLVVWRGSAELHLGLRYGRLPHALQVRASLAGLQPSSPRAAVALTSLQVGDRVVARGRVNWIPDETSESYREPAGQARLEAPGGAETADPAQALALGAAGRRRVRGPARRYPLLGALLGAALALGVTALWGEHAFSEAQRLSRDELRQDSHRCTRSHDISPYVVAAATPFRRSRALSLLDSDLSYRCRMDRQLLQQAVAVRELRQRCRAGYDLLMDRRQLTWALRQWQRCPNPDKAYLPVTPLYALGRFGEASDRAQAAVASGIDIPYYEWQLHVRVHLLAGKLGRAASSMKALLRAENLRLSKERSAVSRGYQRAQLKLWRCVAARVEQLAGDGTALGRLERMTRTSGLSGCAALWLAGTPTAGRAQVLDALEQRKVDPPKGYGREELGQERIQLQRALAGRSAELPVVFRKPAELLIRPRYMSETVSDVTWRQAALQRLAAEQDPPPARRRYRASLAYQLGLAQLLLGQGASARRWFKLLVSDFAALKEEPLSRLDQIMFHSAQDRVQWATAQLAALEARLGRIKLAEQLLGPILHTKHAEPVWALLQLRQGLKRLPGSLQRLLDRGLRQQRPWELVVADDGDGFYRWLLGAYDYGGAPLALGAPRLKGAEQRMRALVRWGRQSSSSLDDSVKDRVGELVDRLLAARALGMKQLTAQLEQVRARFSKALQREAIALPLVLLDGE